jgi:hypothetical protein
MRASLNPQLALQFNILKVEVGVMRRLVLSFVGLLLAIPPVQATILHVPSEYATIQAGIDASVSGDTVLVSDGLYSEHLNFLGKGIFVKSENGPLATVVNLDIPGVPMVTFANGEDSMSVLEGFSLAGDESYWGIYCSGTSPTIYGNVISAQEIGILAEYGQPTVRNNEIISCIHQDLAPWNGGGMRLSHVSGVLIDSNTIWYNFAASWGGAIFMEYCDSIRVERNTIFANGARHVSAIGIDTSFAISIENNLILQNQRTSSAPQFAAVYALHGGDLLVENNVIAFNGQYGVGGPDQTVIDYNAFFGNSQGDVNYLVPGLNNIYENPLFVNYAGLDFRIRGNSPCINAGNPANPPDPDGTRLDIGAFYAERGYIAGTVRDESNQPISDVYVTTTDTSEFAITDTDGEYLLALPCNYEYDVFFTHPDYQEYLAEDISVIAAESTSLDINLTYSPTTPGGIEGFVVDSIGGPIAGVNVVADYTGISDITDSTGYFLLSGLRPRSYSLFFAHDDFEDLELPGVIVEAGETTTLPPTVMYGQPSMQRIYVPEDFATIQAAINNCRNGDTILVGQGTYHESLNFVYSSPVTLMARGDRDSTIIRAPDSARAIVFSLTVDTTTVLKGFTIVGDTLRDGIFTTGGARPIIYGNIIKNCRTGIRGSAVVRKNEITECRSHWPVWSSALRLSTPENGLIDSNYIHDNYDENNSIVQLGCGAGTVFEHNIICSNQAKYASAIILDGCPNIILSNNTIVDNVSTDGQYGAAIGVGWSSHAQIKNNIIAHNTGKGVYVNDATADVTYNDLYMNSGGDLYGTPEGEGCLHSSPLFADHASADYRLMGASPCVDSGDPATPNDPDGTPPDMGAIYAPYLTDYGLLRGSIEDQNSQPIENTTVTILGSSLSDTSDTGGLFSLGKLPESSYGLFFSHHDYIETTLTDISIFPGDTTNLNIVLYSEAARGAIRGIVTNNMNSPIAGAAVTADTVNVIDTTDLQGQYILGDLRPRAYDIIITHPNYSQYIQTGVLVAPGDTVELDITLYENYLMFVGSKDDSPIPALLGGRLDVPVWGATEYGNVEDSVVFMHIPLASLDSAITDRQGGYFPDTLVGLWDDVSFESSYNNQPESSWTSQSMIGFAWMSNPADPQNFFVTNGDTTLICTFVMQVTDDISLQNDTVSIFREGYSPRNEWLIWGLLDGITPIFPTSHYSSVYFLSQSQVGYISGTVYDGSSNPLAGVLVKALQLPRSDTTDSNGDFALDWFEPGDYQLCFSHYGFSDTILTATVTAEDTAIIVISMAVGGGCDYIVGDVNGSEIYNGLDITYGVSFFKGGPDPVCDSCDCSPHPFFWVCGDVNGSCSYNGLDITYGVSYFKGGPIPNPCADCPPSGAISAFSIEKPAVERFPISKKGSDVRDLK